MRSRWYRWLLLAALSAGPVVAYAQEEGISQRQQERIQAKKAKEEKKEQAKKEKEGRKRHLDLQDKATRKRMKQHTRRADRSGPGPHRDGFFSRLFTRRR